VRKLATLEGGGLEYQRNIFRKQSNYSTSALRASYRVVVQLLAEESKHFFRWRIRKEIFGIHRAGDLSGKMKVFLVRKFVSYRAVIAQSVQRLGYGLDDRSSRVRFPAGTGNFSLHYRVQNGSGAQTASYTMGTGFLSLGVKRPGSEADHSTPPTCLHGVVFS
jgi:hypothetical protein